MPTPTYVPLANITLTSNVNSIFISSISQAYKDLILISTSKTTGADVYMNFNSDTSSTYNDVYLFGNGSGAFSNGVSSSNGLVIDFVNEGISVVQIMDYSSTDKHKTVITRLNDTGIGTQIRLGRWPSTNAITSINFPSMAFASGTTLALYGVTS